MSRRPLMALVGFAFFYLLFAVQFGPLAWEFPVGMLFLGAGAFAVRRGTLLERQVDWAVILEWSAKPQSPERREFYRVINRHMRIKFAWALAFGACCAAALVVLYVWVT